MARIRSIKPEFWISDQVTECSPVARLMFIGIWTFCDDGGRMPCSPKRIKAQIFPGDDISSSDIQRMVDELSSNGLVELYEIENKRYLQVTGWKHQKIEKPHYQFPDKNGVVPENRGPDGKFSRRTVGDESPAESSRVESSRKESSRKEGSRVESKTRARASVRFGDWPADFHEQFWKAYPNKQNERATFKALDAKRDELEREKRSVPWSSVMAGIATYVETKPPDRNWMNPRTFIEGERWNDQPAPRSNGNGHHDGGRSGDTAARLAREAEERERGQTDARREAQRIGGTEIGGDDARDVSRR